MGPRWIRFPLCAAVAVLACCASAQDVREFIDILHNLPSEQDVYMQCAHKVNGKGNWHLHTNATRPRQGAGVAGVGAYENAEIYFFGGREDNGFRVAPTRLAIMERFSVSKNTWEESVSMSVDRDDAGVAVLSTTPEATDAAKLPENYRFMATGGYSDFNGVLRSTEVFDVGAQAWSTGPPMVLPRYGHGVAVWFPPAADALNPSVSAFVPPFYKRTKHVVIALGGDAGTDYGFEDSVEWLWLDDEGKAMEWEHPLSLPAGRSPPLRSSQEPWYWAPAPSRMTFRRAGTAAVVHDNMLYAVTGEQDGSGRPERCSLLDLCLVWERLSPMRYPRTRAAVTFFPPLGGIFVAGGYRDDIGFLPRLLQPSEVYFVNGTPPMWAALYGENTTQEPHWEEFPHSRYARYAFHVTALPVHGPRGLRDWRMYSVGGFNSSGGRTSCMEEFSCYHSQWAQMAGAQHAAPTAIVLLLAALSAVSSLLSAG